LHTHAAKKIMIVDIFNLFQFPIDESKHFIAPNVASESDVHSVGLLKNNWGGPYVAKVMRVDNTL